MAKKSKTPSKAVAAQPAKARFCSMKVVPPRRMNPGINSGRMSMIIVNASKWVNGTRLKYYFFDNKTDGANVKGPGGKKVWMTWIGTKGQMDMVRKAFGMWKKIGIGLEFEEVKNREDAEIRIGFMEDDGAWSYVGRDVLQQGVNERTMNFGWNIDTPDTYNGIDTALHEIGHTLGFPHEHQNPFAGIVWDEPLVYKSLAQKPNEWNKEITYENIIKKLNTTEVNGSQWDPNSIMHYPFEPGMILKPAKYTATGLQPKGGLSANDIKWAKHFYPPLKNKSFAKIEPLVSKEVTAENSKQQDFSFAPDETRYYTIQTYGKFDAVVVLFERDNNKLKYLTASDNSGTEENASLKLKLFRGKEYVLKVRVYYKAKNEKATLMVF